MSTSIVMQQSRPHERGKHLLCFVLVGNQSQLLIRGFQACAHVSKRPREELPVCVRVHVRMYL